MFRAHAQERNLVVANGGAVLEAEVVGRLCEQLGDNAPSESEVRIPRCGDDEIDGDSVS